MKLIARLFGRESEKESFYGTRVVEGPSDDGSWTAELTKDGVPYGYVRVGSISALIARSK